MAKRLRQFSPCSGLDEANNSNVDRISCLHLPLLHRILSFLETLDMVRTCVLSKRWRNIWCSVPTLDFDDESFPHRRLDIVKFANSTLFLRDGSDIQKLRLLLLPTQAAVSRINEWILYAIRHRVQVLDVATYFDEYRYKDLGKIELTAQIFTSESLRECKLSSLRINLPSSICLPALRVLHLRFVHFKDEQLDEVSFSATPSLETIVIEHCLFKNCPKLVISAPQLKSLTMMSKFPSSVEISAPNLVFFKLRVLDRSPETISIKFNSELLSLSNAIIAFQMTYSEPATELISTIRNAQSLTLSEYFLASFAVILEKDPSALNRVQIPFCNLKRLRIDTDFGTSEILLINNLLKHSLGIESLILVKTRDYYYATRRDKHDETEKLWSNYKLCNLKLVEIHEFKGTKNELKMIKFILANAIVLEKLIILIAKNSPKMMKIGRMLLTYPRSSSSVGILFAQDATHREDTDDDTDDDDDAI